MQKNNLYALIQKTRWGQHTVAEVVAPNKKTAEQLFEKSLRYSETKDGDFFVGQLYFAPYQVGKAKPGNPTRHELQPRKVSLIKLIDKNPFPHKSLVSSPKKITTPARPLPPSKPVLTKPVPQVKPVIARPIPKPVIQSRPIPPSTPVSYSPVKPTIRSNKPVRTYPNRQGSPVKSTIVRKK